MPPLTHPLTDSVLHHQMQLRIHPPLGRSNNQLMTPQTDRLRQPMMQQAHNRAASDCGEILVTP